MKKMTGAVVILAVFLSISPAFGKIGGGDIAFKVNGAGIVLFSHDSHVGQRGLKCAECHQLYSIAKMSNGTSMADMQKGKYCGSCHNGKRAFDAKSNCDKCHKT
jgi:c(7)-type cytochrome triheme protein